MFQKEGMRDTRGQCTQIIIYSNGLMHSTFLQRNLFSYLPVAGVHGKYMLFCLFNHTKTPTYHPHDFHYPTAAVFLSRWYSNADVRSANPNILSYHSIHLLHYNTFSVVTPLISQQISYSPYFRSSRITTRYLWWWHIQYISTDIICSASTHWVSFIIPVSKYA